MSKANYSENEDDPDVYESSGSEWNSSSEQESKRKNTRRVSTRNKKARIKADSSSSGSELEEPKPRKKRNGVSKKQKVNSNSESSDKNGSNPVSTKEFATGSFLILKKDAQVGDPNKPPCIWRVDGKALLQKYEPFDENGKTKHRTTSVYTGWSALDRELYAPVTVSVSHHGNQQLIVELNWEKLKEINMDSD